MVLGFNSDSEVGTMNDYLAKNGHEWPQWFMGDERKKLQERFWVSGYPTNFLVGRDGRIISRSIRLGHGDSEEVIEAALKEAAPGDTDTGDTDTGDAGTGDAGGGRRK